MVGITAPPTGAAAPAGAAITAEPTIAAARGAQRPARGRDRTDMKQPFRGGRLQGSCSVLRGSPGRAALADRWQSERNLYDVFAHDARARPSAGDYVLLAESVYLPLRYGGLSGGPSAHRRGPGAGRTSVAAPARRRGRPLEPQTAGRADRGDRRGRPR